MTDWQLYKVYPVLGRIAGEGTLCHHRRMTGKFLNRDPGQEQYAEGDDWSEGHIQAYIVQEARRAGYQAGADDFKGLVAGDMNAGKRSPMGMAAVTALAGAPDLRFFLPGSLLIQIELKCLPSLGGRLTKPQKELHPILAELGFIVYTVYAASPLDGWRQVQLILLKHEGKRK